MIWLPVVGNYADVDVYASIIAYADLLNQRGKSAKTYIPFAPNYSVPTELRILDQENAVWDFAPDDQAIILDVSVPEAINKLVPDNQILELIDHHSGYEEYWHLRIGDKATIKNIGAVATLVFERWGECWNYEKMSPAVAKLLMAAVLDNTLYFNTKNTTKRDRKAAEEMAKIANTTVDEFAKWYFSRTSNTIIANLKESLVDDCKKVILSGNQLTLAFAQLAIWGARELVSERTDRIREIMEKLGEEWVVSVLCISERKNYIITSSGELDEYFKKLLGLKHNNSWLESDKLYLRKEVIAKMQKNKI